MPASPPKTMRSCARQIARRKAATEDIEKPVVACIASTDFADNTGVPGGESESGVTGSPRAAGVGWVLKTFGGRRAVKRPVLS